MTIFLIFVKSFLFLIFYTINLEKAPLLRVYYSESLTPRSNGGLEDGGEVD